MARPSGRGWSRRTLLASFSLLRLPAAVRRGTSLPSETIEYLDPTTEFVVNRLTDPAHASYLPASFARFVSTRRGFLLYASDRTGSMQAYRLDLKSGKHRLLTEAGDLRPRTLTLLPDERSFLYQDGGRIHLSGLGGGQPRPVHDTADGTEIETGLGVSDDGRFVCFSEKSAGGWLARMLDLKTGRSSAILKSASPLGEILPRPGHRELLVRQESGELWTCTYSGQKRRRVQTPAGEVGPAVWTQDGRAILYLLYPEDRTKLNMIREYFANSRQDRLVARTTQYVSFGSNADSSVFVGASGGRATPYVILMLRVGGGHELTVCEHRSTSPASVTPVFSPNSRWVFFQSDRDGRPAIYSMKVDDLVEATEQEL